MAISAFPGHGGGNGEPAVAPNVIGAKTNAHARQPHRLLIVAPEEVSVGRDAIVHSRKRITRAQPQRPSGGRVGILPAAAKSEREAVHALRQSEIRIEVQRQLELGKGIVEAP